MWLAWCAANPNVSTVITGASRPSQVAENFAAIDVLPMLTPEVMARIDRGRRITHPRRRGTLPAPWPCTTNRSCRSRCSTIGCSCSIPDKDGERRSTGGILIPATAQIAKRLVWAEVVALGQNVRSAEVGDRVLFSPDDRYEVEVRGDDYIMLRERDLHAVAASRIEASTGLYL